MLQKNRSLLFLSLLTVGVIILLITLSTPATAYADDPIPTPNHGKCISCHENLYFLHDTGNWYCLKESPMTCAGCHGGNPNATTEELAHTNRMAHPVINDNISKCQECHPDECMERLQIFDETAGISKVLVAVPYTPSYSTTDNDIQPIEAQQASNSWINAMKFISILFIAGVAVFAYIIHQIISTAKRKS
jgi:hypothetical protein